MRDIQYELAVRKIAELKKEKSRIEHAKDSDRGVEEFQKILKRSGLGGDDGSNQKMTVSYEDGESFINRLEETVQQKWPSNEEVSDFLTQLKDRTAEKRQARYEKERRKRRALIDQEK